MPLILGANSASGGYNVANSLRFNSGSSDYLNRTPASTGNRQKWTLSGWYKLAVTNTTDRTIFGAGTDGDNQTLINFQDTSVILFNYELSNVRYIVDTDAVYRDQSAWYHVVVAVDTTQATDTNRVKIYVNGVQQTLAVVLNGYPPQNANTFVNNTSAHSIGYASWVSSNFYNGYMSDVYLIDGQQLTPSSFGETDEDTNIWKPKAYTGSFGTNGFYLQFKNSGALGTDSSGNGNTFTVNNLTSVDQTTDTPTNNFATLNPLSIGSRITLTEGNLQQSTATSTSQSCRTYSTIAMSSGKWYCEYKVLSGVWNMIGIATVTDAPTVGFLGNTAGSYSYYQGNGTPQKYNNSSGSSYGASFTTNDIIGIAFDADNGTLTFYKNGSSQGTAFTGIPSGTYYFAEGDSSNDTWSGAFNFGSPIYSANSYTDGAGFGNFSYAVPSGYYSLNTKNLANFG
jgi:hypothetical protein